MSTVRQLRHTYRDYLRALEESDFKLEWCDGEIYLMAGGTPVHADLAASIIALLHGALQGRCRVSTSDLKVRVEATDLSTFPDASVVCGERRTADIDANAVVNPTVLVEVTNPSSEAYDFGDKLSHYKQIPSLRAVILISHRRREVTVVERTESGWTERRSRGGETARLGSPELTLAVDEIYAGLEL